MKKGSYAAALLAVLAVGLAGCGSGDPNQAGSSSTGGANASGGTGKKYNIAVIPKGSTHVYWKSVEEGANTAEKELGDVSIKWQGPEKENDREQQIKIVEDMITAKVDGIVLAPLDNVALRAPVADATKAGIPVVIIDSGLESKDYISEISTDNEKGGHMAGEYLAKLLNGKGKVIMLRYEEGSASTMAREKGFLDEMAKNPGIQVVGSNQYGGATADSAQKASENLLSGYKQGDGLSIDGIYCPNESTTFGMLRVLEDGHYAGKVKFVGFDASDKLLEGLTKGEINGLIIQNPRKMGYLGVKTVEQYIKGNKNVDKKVDTGATLVTKENMDTPDNKKLLAPPNV